jgi:hypothetical protein
MRVNPHLQTLFSGISGEKSSVLDVNVDATLRPNERYLQVSWRGTVGRKIRSLEKMSGHRSFLWQGSMQKGKKSAIVDDERSIV